MKISILTVLFISIFSTQSFAANESNYECLANKLQAFNSDIYYNLNSADIFSMLTIAEMRGHLDAKKFEAICENELNTSTSITSKQYQCIADSLEAINSDIYYNLSSAEIDAMLTIPEMMGHVDATNASRRCGVK